MLSIASLLAAGSARGEDGGSDEFLKKDNWQGLEEFWSVKDGAIVGTTPADLKYNTFLCSKKKYKDFELKFQVRLKDGKGNSGVQIRSKIVDTKKFAVARPAVRHRHRLLGQPLRRELRRHDEGAARGRGQEGRQAGRLQRLLHQVRRQARHDQVNGETTVDDDFAKMPDEGIIAWQLHGWGDGSDVQEHRVQGPSKP